MAIPDRFTLRQAAHSREIIGERDLGEAVHLNRTRPRLAKGPPNRNPEHERKRRAPSQQDADDNPAMPTAKFGIGEFYHWFRGTDIARECSKKRNGQLI